MIDFTSPASLRHWLKTCRDRGIAMVIGTTGLAEQDHAAIDRRRGRHRDPASANMSVGVNLLFKSRGSGKKLLGDDYDIEIVEGHHRFKKDAPSGTALGIADSILKATGKTGRPLVHDRHGDEALRNRGEIECIPCGSETRWAGIRHIRGAGRAIGFNHVARAGILCPRGPAARPSGSRARSRGDMDVGCAGVSIKRRTLFPPGALLRWGGRPRVAAGLKRGEQAHRR